MNSNSIQLKQSCTLNVPIQNYDDPFTFVVNGEEFKTTKLISDLLSPKISKIHQNDPTFDTITINTLNKKGHFPQILKLLSFNSIEIPSIEIPFIFMGNFIKKLTISYHRISLNYLEIKKKKL